MALPFVVMGARPGLEVVHPMAVVLLGGLVTSTFLALFVLPALYPRIAVPAQATLPPEDELLQRWIEPEPATATAGSPGPAPSATNGEGNVSAPAGDGPPPAAAPRGGAA
jgi:hypothetical protein